MHGDKYDITEDTTDINVIVNKIIRIGKTRKYYGVKKIILFLFLKSNVTLCKLIRQENDLL